MSVLSDHLEQTKPAVGSGLPVLPRVNLLPPEIAERTRFRRIQYGLGGGVLAAAGVVALLYLAAVGSVNDATTELETANTTNTALKAETAKYADVQRVYGQAAAAQAMLTQAMGQEVRFSQYLNDLSLTVPENIWLTNVSFKQATATPAAGTPSTASPGVGTTEPGIGSVTFTGVGFKHDDVAAWLESLAKQKGYTNPYFTSSTKALIGTRATVNFTSTVTLTPAALSGRFTTPAGG